MAFDYITVRQAAEKWGVTMRRVQQMCEHGIVDSAIRPGRDWLIPAELQIPGRRRGRWRDNEASTSTKEDAAGGEKN